MKIPESLLVCTTCIAVSFMAVTGILVITEEKESLMCLSEDGFIHFVPMLILGADLLIAVIFFMAAIVSCSIRLPKSCEIDKTGASPASIMMPVLLIGNTVILFMHATHQHPSGTWSQVEFGISAVTPLGALLECVLLLAVLKIYQGR